MPITRQLIACGTSKGITLPKSWIENIEVTTGKKVIAVAMEVNDKIIITPILEK